MGLIHHIKEVKEFSKRVEKIKHDNKRTIFIIIIITNLKYKSLWTKISTLF